jgi:hypothetical protein
LRTGGSHLCLRDDEGHDQQVLPEHALIMPY